MSETNKPPPEAGNAPEEPKLTPAELKKRAKAEKQARRAAQKGLEPGVPSASTPIPNGVDSSTSVPKGGSSQEQKGKTSQAKPAGQQTQQQKQGKAPGTDNQTQRAGPSNQQQSMPVRRRPSQSGPPPPQPKKKENKQVELFSHLYTQPRRHTAEGAPKDIHPSVLALGFRISSYEICGSSARCVAMLLAFKDAIQAYTTPTGISLPRHLTSHYLSPQIDFLKSCRPISESMGNAIRYLKKLVVEIDPSMPEQEAKDYLCAELDRFVHERITVTDQAIAASASPQIRPGAVVLTYAKSAIVEKTLLQAHREHKRKFRVIVVDSRPLFEGKNLATSLINAGIEVEYVPFSGLAHAVKDATLVLLGAHSMLSNGRLQSRVGTASVAMHAHRLDIPVLVCCESVKFSGKVALDSIVLNEVAPEGELLLPSSNGGASNEQHATNGDDEGSNKTKTMHDWRDLPGLQILNLMYDVTPAEYIRMVICEYGSVPPSSVPVVHRLANEGM